MSKKKATTEEELGEIMETIERAEGRAMAADGPVAKTVACLEDAELTRIYRLAKRGKRRLAALAKDRPKFRLEDIDEKKLALALQDAEQSKVLPSFRRKWAELTKGGRQHFEKAARALKSSLFKVGVLR